MAPQAIRKPPFVNHLLNWFKRDEPSTDNHLFRLHHQYTTFIIMFGFLFIFIENYLDGRAITCQGGDQYTKAYCWIHGSSYVGKHLQGEITGCFVHPDIVESANNEPVTSYYLWLPLLLTFCFLSAKLPRNIWRSGLEGGKIKNILQDNKNLNIKAIHSNFQDERSFFFMYQIKFMICEILNLVMIGFSIWTTHILLRSKFRGYGPAVLKYLFFDANSSKEPVHNPMCEVFPTEVGCRIRVGSPAGGIEEHNYLCILSNNLFNQKYFLFLWVWWICLAIISFLGLIYRCARIAIPDFSRYVLSLSVKSVKLENLKLSSGDCFVLDRLNKNMIPRQMNLLLEEIRTRQIKQENEENTDISVLLDKLG